MLTKLSLLLLTVLLLISLSCAPKGPPQLEFRLVLFETSCRLTDTKCICPDLSVSLTGYFGVTLWLELEKTSERNDGTYNISLTYKIAEQCKQKYECRSTFSTEYTTHVEKVTILNGLPRSTLDFYLPASKISEELAEEYNKILSEKAILTAEIEWLFMTGQWQNQSFDKMTEYGGRMDEIDKNLQKLASWLGGNSDLGNLWKYLTSTGLIKVNILSVDSE